MMRLLDGLALAASLKKDLIDEVLRLKEHFLTPSLAVILVGDNPASKIYVESKCKQCLEVGIKSTKILLPADVSWGDLSDAIESLNNDQSVHGILIQLPLPNHIDASKAIDLIDPSKDVDGLNTINMGRLLCAQENAVLPCTPQGVMHLINSTGIDLCGKKALVIGRSRLVGIPTSQLLLQKNCTVTTAHSKSIDLEELCKDAEIVIAACGQMHLIKGSWLKKCLIAIDVGIHKHDGHLYGDIDRNGLNDNTYISPVPGGVGPLTVAFLLKNTIELAKRNIGKPVDSESR
jgi:methylenetetrahydrofolate dehydrogenase (NADP+)/methenyltetrahydrofolate cyclohydrolase